MRIFQILEFNSFLTGSVHQMFQAAVGLHERGHDVTVISRPGSSLEEAVRTKGIAFAGVRMRNEFDIASARVLNRLAKEKNPDVIHVHKGTSHALALAATWRRPVDAFVVNRGVSFPLDVWNRIKYRTARVDRVVTVCQQIKDVIVESGSLPPEKVDVVYAGTDVHEFDRGKWDPHAFRAEKNIAPDRFLISQVGLRDWKGWKELIDSTSDVAKEHPRVHLALIGCRSDQEKQDVLAYAETRGVRERVTPVEYRDDMPSVFAASDLVVDASWAGTGITGTIREAMAMQKPVIATSAGGNEELVSSPDVGWLIPMRDRAALSSSIREVIADPARAERIARNAREHVVRGFSKDLRITRLEELYRSIVQSKDRRRAG